MKDEVRGKKQVAPKGGAMASHCGFSLTAGSGTFSCVGWIKRSESTNLVV